MQLPAPNKDTLDTPSPWLRRFCYLTLIATFSLIAIGGHVTSTDVGLAVPDGFTTFGHFTLFAPLEVWWDDFGTRWEHSHRLKGMIVGMMTIVMAVWLLIGARGRPLLRYAGLIMLGLVIGQGVMGALRVSEISLTLAFVHGIGGQLILCAWVVIAAALGVTWVDRLRAIAKRTREDTAPVLRWAVRGLLVLLLAQLTLGSAVRHFKADKAIPDFPLTYGQVLPPMSQDALDERYIEYYSQALSGPDAATVKAMGLITNRTPQGEIVVALSDVDLQFAHRLGAIVVCIAGLYVIIAAIRRTNADQRIMLAPSLALLMLLTAQFALGVMTVFTGTAPLIATLHQATGAALIAVATWLAVRIHLAEYPAAQAIADTPPANGHTPAAATVSA